MFHLLSCRVMPQDGVKVGSHLYSAFLKTCAAAGTPQLLDLGMAVYHDLYCHWQTLYSGSAASKAEQECALSLRPFRRPFFFSDDFLLLWLCPGPSVDRSTCAGSVPVRCMSSFRLVPAGACCTP